jgi:hypothetical protein
VADDGRAAFPYYGRLLWTFIMDVYYGRLLWTFIMDVYYGRLLWTFIMDAYYGRLLWTFIMDVIHDPSAYAAVVSAVSRVPQPGAGSHNGAQAASRRSNSR